MSQAFINDSAPLVNDRQSAYSQNSQQLAEQGAMYHDYHEEMRDLDEQQHLALQQQLAGHQGYHHYDEESRDLDEQQQLALEQELQKGYALQQQQGYGTLMPGLPDASTAYNSNRQSGRDNSADSSNKNSLNSGKKEQDKQMNSQEQQMSSRKLCLLISTLVVMCFLAGGIVTWAVLATQDTQSRAKRRKAHTPEKTISPTPKEEKSTKGDDNSHGLGFLSPGTQSESNHRALSDIATGGSAVGEGESAVGEHRVESRPLESLTTMMGAGASIGILFAFHEEIWKAIFGERSVPKNLVEDKENLVGDKDAVGGENSGDSLVDTRNDLNAADPNKPGAQPAVDVNPNDPKRRVEVNRMEVTEYDAPVTDGAGTPVKSGAKIQTQTLFSQFTVKNYKVDNFRKDFFDGLTLSTWEYTANKWTLWDLGKFDDGTTLGWASDENHPAYRADFFEKFENQKVIDATPESKTVGSYDPCRFSLDEFPKGSPQKLPQPPFSHRDHFPFVDVPACRVTDERADEMPSEIYTALLDYRQVSLPGLGGLPLPLKAYSSILIKTNFERNHDLKKMWVTRKVSLDQVRTDWKKIGMKDKPLKYTVTIEGQELVDGSLLIYWTGKIDEVNANMDNKWPTFAWNQAMGKLLEAWKFQVNAMISHLNGEK